MLKYGIFFIQKKPILTPQFLFHDLGGFFSSERSQQDIMQALDKLEPENRHNIPALTSLSNVKCQFN